MPTINCSPAIDAGTPQFTLASGETVLYLAPGEYWGAAPDLGRYESSFGSASNTAPTVDAGPDQTITLSATPVNLSGTVTDDGNPNPPGQTSSTWSKASGPPGVLFGDPNQPVTTATFPGAGVYVLRLEASDTEWVSSDELAVTVLDPNLGQVAVRVAASSYDAEERIDGRISLTSSDLELVFDRGGHQTVRMRFNGLAIPQGAKSPTPTSNSRQTRPTPT